MNKSYNNCQDRILLIKELFISQKTSLTYRPYLIMSIL